MDSRRNLKKNDEKRDRVQILSVAEIKQNEEKFAQFQACVQALTVEFERDIISGIDVDEVTAFQTILESLKSITSPNAAGEDKKSKYVLKVNSVIDCLNNMTADLQAMKSSTTFGNDIAQLENARCNKTNFYLNLTRLSASMCYCLRQTEKSKLKLTSFLPAIIAPILLIGIPAILFICGVFANPMLFLLLGFAALLVSSVFVSRYFTNIKILMKPTFHPIKDAISSLMKKISENILGYQNQLKAAKCNQEIQNTTKHVCAIIKTRRDTFFGVGKADHKDSPCYQGLVNKQAAKIACLNENLVTAQNELEAAQTALKFTEDLIKDGNEEAIKNYEKRLLSYASVENVPDDIKILGNNRHQQTVAVRLCAKKIEALTAAIKNHESEFYVNTKFNKYRHERYSEAAIDKLSLKNSEACVYGNKERYYYRGYYHFTHIPLQVKPHVNHRQGFLYNWSNDEKSDIRFVNSAKVNHELSRELETIQEAVVTERKNRYIN